MNSKGYLERTFNSIHCFSIYLFLIFDRFGPHLAIRELKQRQRRRQRERHEFAYLVGKNNSFARPARAFFTFVHFVAVVSKTTT